MNFSGNFVDSILPDKIAKLNVSFLVDKLDKSYGGTAGNIAYSLGLLEAKVGVIGAAGSDFESYKLFLNKHCVDTENIKIVSNKYTSTAFCVTDQNSNQIWGFYPGADEDAISMHLKNVKDDVSLVIIAPNNPEVMMSRVSECKELGLPYMFDPGMQLPRLSNEDLTEAIEKAYIVIGNDYETEIMQKRLGISDLHTLANDKCIVITTLGSEGMIASDGVSKHTIRAATVSSVIDPSGAGDSFRSGLVAGLQRGLSLETACEMGAIAAAYVVENQGATSHEYTLEKFIKRYYENYNKELIL
ncbi:MAG: carbohydrate kinase family protein [bacterium]|nr:carbohydrate kinase family protein [bacterium]